jgi:hypothetical protein
MSYQEKSSISSIFCSAVIFISYCVYVLQKYQAGSLDLSGDLSSWGLMILIFILVSIVVRILSEIVLNIVNAIATQKADDVMFADERDKLIDLKGMRVSAYIGGIGFLLSLATLALKMPSFVMLNVAYLGFMLGDVAGEITKLHHYRQGV